MQKNKKHLMKRPVSHRFVMPYGKYKGKTILDISEQDPGYVLWFNENSEYAVESRLIAACKSGTISPDFEG